MKKGFAQLFGSGEKQKQSRPSKNEEHEEQPTKSEKLIEMKFFYSHNHYVTIELPYVRDIIIDQRWVRNELLCHLQENFRNVDIIAMFSPAYRSFRNQISYPLSDKVTKLVFGWQCTISLKASSKIQLLTKEYYFRSNQVSNSFESLTAAIQASRLSEEYFLFDEGTKQPMDLLRFQNVPRAEIELLVVNKTDNYANLGIIQLLSHIDFRIPPSEKLGEVTTGSRNRSFHALSLLDKMSLSGNKSLLKRIENFRNRIAEAGKVTGWKELVTETTSRLNRLDRSYLPPSNLNEAARRLVINDIIISVCDFMEVKFNVEDKILGEIGFGYLDFQFYPSQSPFLSAKAVVEGVDELHLPPDFMEQQMRESELEKSEGGATALKPAATKNMLLSEPRENLANPEQSKVLEAKESFRDKALAQFAAQVYDTMKKFDLTTARGVLSTGTRWKFFVLQDGSLEKPELSFEGEVSLQIFKSASSGNKRLSAEEVKCSEVENVMIALAASFM